MALENRPLLAGARIADADLDEEAVELRLRQRIRPLKLQRVLRGEDGEEVVERVRLAVNRHLALFHALQQRGLRARRHAVDLVGQQELREDRAAMKRELTGLQREDAGAENIGGHHVRRALDAAKVEREESGQRLHGHGFRHAGYAFHQRVSAAKKREDGLLDQLRLARDDPAQLRLASFKNGEHGPDFAVVFGNFGHAFPWVGFELSPAFCCGLRIRSLNVAICRSRRRTSASAATGRGLSYSA